MATKTVNARNYTKADFENKLRYLNDPQELAKLLNELSEPYPYYVFRGKQLSFLADTNNRVSPKTQLQAYTLKHTIS